MTSQPLAHTVESLARRLGGEIRGRGDLPISGINSLNDAGPGEITFISDEKHARRWGQSQAAAAIVTRTFNPSDHDATSRALILVSDAELATIEILRLFEPPAPLPDVGVHPTAFVHPQARLGRDVRIGPHVSVDRGAQIGERTVLHAGARIYADVTIGPDTIIHANTVIRERCRIGRGVILHQNVSIGADGFGYRPAPVPGGGTMLRKVPHIGIVVIGDDVEIGAGSCVDRAKFGATTIGNGTKIDNLCQIGHNCRIGQHCVIAGLTGLSGSVVVGDGAMIAGNVGVAEHVNVGRGASIAAKSGVMDDIPDGQTYLGYPAGPIRETLRQMAIIRKLPELVRRLDRPDTGESR